MGRSPSTSGDDGLKKGPWSPEEDQKLTDYINKHGHGSWQALPKKAGLNRCGKSCRLRWTNYLRPDIKRGRFSDDEEEAIIKLHSIHGNKWSTIASHLPGRTDNEIKNYWNTHLRKKLIRLGIDPQTHKPIYDFNLLSNLSQLLSTSNTYNLMNPLETALSLQADVAQVATSQLLQNILQIMNSSTLPNNLQENFILGLNNFPNFDGLVNGTSPHYSLDPFQGLATLPRSGDVEQLLNAHSTNANSPGFSNGVFSPEIPVNGVKNFSSGCCSEREYSLPALVPASPGTSNFNQMDSIDKTSYIPTCTFQSSFFDGDWENAVDKEESNCFWKDIIP